MNAIRNFLFYLKFHPAIKNIDEANIVIGFSEKYSGLISEMVAFNTLAGLNYKFTPYNLEKEKKERLMHAIDEECDLFLLFYDSSTLKNPTPHGPEYIYAINPVIKKNWKKSVLFKDYGQFFNEAFMIDPERIANINNKLIQIAHASTQLKFTDNNGSHLTAKLSAAEQKWTNINGIGNLDIVPGEIATHSDEINGKVYFSGAFLSTIPFAIKYGVIEQPLELHIEDSEIKFVGSENSDLKRDFNKYLSMNSSNRRIEELGIGTNEGVIQLHGRNAGFEERHCGLHLGLGGGAMGSHHLDLIFSSGSINFDKTQVFGGKSYLV
ncbi:M29 family metallopeptidase [Piscirickettsia litoralis]|uniref:Leucyl aminopeptidase n=1 Tax=Piscirickettsia litoralis TaxID=1891921 RepID=A0ABX3A408_9GAMM|nr:leucyl aminopeptidase [Piscirickettsia litoralis]ODN43188.1 leucyl aminopeptidase [Piscirickettsia litoralis]